MDCSYWVYIPGKANDDWSDISRIESPNLLCLHCCPIRFFNDGLTLPTKPHHSLRTHTHKNK